MSTATADMLAIERRTSPYGPRVIPITETESEARPVGNTTTFEFELPRNRLAEIAALVQKLTYGEMIELAAALWAHRPTDSERPYADPLPVTQETLPGILHRWSTK